MAKEELTAKVVAAPGAAITLDFKMATELLKMFGEEPGLITLQHGSESSHSGTGLYARYSDMPDEGAEFLGAEPDDEAVPEAVAVQDALAYQEACSLATHLFKKHFSKDVEYASGKVTWGLCDTTAGVISQIDNMVCGLVEPTAQATLMIKPLQWSDEREPSEDVRYNHVVAESPLGRITVEWKGWKKYDSRCVYVGGEYIDSGSTLEDAKKIAEYHLQNVVEALTTAAQTGWCKDCNPDNCSGCATPAAPAQVGEYPELPPLQVRYDGLGHTTTMGYGVSQMRDYADATCAARGAAQAASADAERYRWLFDARTKSQAESFSGTISNPLPQDVVISHLQGFFMHKAQVDEMVDTAMAAQKGSAT